jgi:hypothetical protein
MKIIRIILLVGLMIQFAPIYALGNQMSYGMGEPSHQQWAQSQGIRSVAPMRKSNGYGYQSENGWEERSYQNRYMTQTRNIVLTEPFSDLSPYDNSTNNVSTGGSNNPFADRGRPGGPGVPNLVPLDCSWDAILLMLAASMVYILRLRKKRA